MQRLNVVVAPMHEGRHFTLERGCSHRCHMNPFVGEAPQQESAFLTAIPTLFWAKNALFRALFRVEKVSSKTMVISQETHHFSMRQISLQELQNREEHQKSVITQVDVCPIDTRSSNDVQDQLLFC